MRNIECKYELRDLALARGIAALIGAVRAGELVQTDTYFKLAAGRLKRRETVGEPTEWVMYERADSAAPRVSDFTLFSEEQAAARFGVSGLPPWVIVRKRRELWLWKDVRIHLDTVENLGDFLEFEALVSPASDENHGHDKIRTLRSHLGTALGEPIALSYCDLAAHQDVKSRSAVHE